MASIREKTLKPGLVEPSPLRAVGYARRRSLKKSTVVILASFLGLGTLHTLIQSDGNNAGCRIQNVFDKFADWSDEHFDFGASDALSAEDLCPQAIELLPSKNSEIWDKLGETYYSGEFKSKAVQWLGGAIRVPTESYDKMQPVGVDPRWEVFGLFHNYLLKAFPRIHSTLKLTKVNTYGLVYHWQGSDDSLKPLMLTAHQDVVPVDPKTIDQWEYLPYSGYFDGERIWGRGTSDDKSGLIGIMSSIETLLKNGFEPKRSVVLAFGFDEETSGLYGAKTLGPALLSTYGENSMAMLVDEGGTFGAQYGGVFAFPGVSEKGYMDIRVEVNAPGGHSSIPPDHTSIGMLSSILTFLEAHPPVSSLGRENPMYKTIQCLAAHAPTLPHNLRKTIKRSVKSDRALKGVEKFFFSDRAVKSLIGTTQAIDLIQGGVKTNALPEQAWAVVNHRISTQSSPDVVMNRTTQILMSHAAEFNLSMTAFESHIHLPGIDPSSPTYGSLVLSDAWGTAVSAAPVTPTDFSSEDGEAEPYKLLVGTIKSTYTRHRKDEDLENGKEVDMKNINVAPGYMSGNTDTRYYWKLTPHIFRYNHLNAGLSSSMGMGRMSPGVHTVNECE